MPTDETTFIVRFSLTADVPDILWETDDFDEQSWLNEWETTIKPGLIRVIFAHLRSFPNWNARIRNRGISALDEIEIAVQRRFSLPPPSDVP